MRRFQRSQLVSDGSLALWLSEKDNRFNKFISGYSSKETILNQAVEKLLSYDVNNRQVLIETIENQYKNIHLSAKQKENLEALSTSGLTITTGHQLSLALGPLFLVYKVLQVIKMADEMNKSQSNYKFVPLFWLASEDHDFEEISNVQVFSNNWQLERPENQSNWPVGRMNPGNLASIYAEIKALFNNHKDAEVHELLEFQEGLSYGDQFFNLINKVFGSYGLLVLDGDQPVLKSLFAETMIQEIEQQFVQRSVEWTNGELVKEGIKPQVYVRPINLFYLDESGRTRIEINESKSEYFTEYRRWSREEIVQELRQSPEKFSPNALMRPLYQEKVLPNVSYVGGAGELAYWLQLKSTFESANLQMPSILLRNSFFMIDRSTREKIDNLAIPFADWFGNIDLLKKEWVKNHPDEIDLSKFDDSFTQLKDQFIEASQVGDNNFENQFIADLTRFEKSFDGLKDKLYRFSRKQHEKTLKNFDLIQDRLFPMNQGTRDWQERSWNLFHICPTGDVSDKLHLLYEAIDPFESTITVLES